MTSLNNQRYDPLDPRRRAILGMAAIGVAIPAWATTRPGSDNMAAFYAAWKAAFVRADGRVVDDGQGGISTSESQGYGMLLAWGAGDDSGFDAMWGWTQQHLRVRSDDLLAWRWAPGQGVTDVNNATDGDLIVAWALALAARRRQMLLADSLRLARAIRAHSLRSTPWGVVLMPAVVGFDTPRGPIVNLSYWVFPALQTLATVDPDPVWATLLESGLRLLALARFGRWGLPPDWLLLVDPLEPAPERPPRHGYEAVRIPLYLAWAKRATPELMQPWQAYWRHFPAAGFVPAWVDLQTACVAAEPANPGMRMIRSWVESGRAVAPLDPKALAQSGYYSATLGMLTLMAGRWAQTARPSALVSR